MTAPRLLPNPPVSKRQLDVKREQRHEDVGRDVRSVVRVQRPGQSQRAGANGECLDLEQRDMLARDRGHLFVVADRAQHPPERRRAQAFGQHKGHGDDRHDDGEVQQIERFGRQAPAPGPGDAGDSVGAVGQPDRVAGDDAYGLGEAQRDDGQIVAAQTHGDQRDQNADQRAHHCAGRHAGGDGQPELQRQQRAGIGADGEESDQAEVDHAGQAPDDVHAQRHQRVDAGRHGHRDQIVFHQYARWPRMPRGRSVSTSRIATKPTTLR